MKAVRTSLKKVSNISLLISLNSIYYTSPIGMFLVACNFLFESVRHYYFNWMIVVLPTFAVFVIGNLYEMFVIYQENGSLIKRENTFTRKQVGYSLSNAKLITT